MASRCKRVFRQRILEYGGWIILLYLHWMYVNTRFFEEEPQTTQPTVPKPSCEAFASPTGIKNLEMISVSCSLPASNHSDHNNSNITLQGKKSPLVRGVGGAHPLFCFELLLLLMWFSVIIKYGIYLVNILWKDLVWCRRQRCRRRFLNCDCTY
jgi:hypothetical protein